MPSLLELDKVSKSYGGVRALKGATFSVARPGMVQGLIGENGSGKSTLLGIVSGQTQPDGGTIRLDGAPVAFSTPVAAIRHGIVMVSQETSVVPDLSVGENILLGRRLIRRPRGIAWTASYNRAAQVLERLELDLDVRTPVRSLRPDQRQMVEIARAISMDARILILDEPTSSLTDDEVAHLFKAVRRLSATGVAIVFVSHRFSELADLCDEVTVLRDGTTCASGAMAEYSADRLADIMTGGKALFGHDPRPPSPIGGRPVLEFVDACDGAGLGPISLQVRTGEIVGLAGLVGSGREGLLEMAFGIRPRASGSCMLDGTELAGDPAARIGRGLGYLPPDRKAQGLVLSASVQHNATMTTTFDKPRWQRPGGESERRSLDFAVAGLRLKAASPRVAVSTLSGGNQQKVALSKWLAIRPKALLLDEPTRGVDVVAKADIHVRLWEAAASGMGLLVSSSENEELIGLCDRIAVMYRGRILDVLSREQATETTIARLAGGHQ